LMKRYTGRVIYQRKANGGVASARNAGLELASGEFLAFMDSDDVCEPQRIAAQIACFKQLPDTVLCSSDFSAFDADGLIENSHIASYYKVVAATPGGVKSLYSARQELEVDGQPIVEPPIFVYSGDVYEQLIWGNFIHPPTIMVRRSIVETVGGFDEKISIATEYDWLIRVSRLGRMAYIGASLLRYRYSGDQLTSPSHHVQISLDTVMTMEKLRRADLDLFRRHERRFERRVGTCYLHAADASVEYDKLGAVNQISQSLMHGVFTYSSLKVIIKLLMPRLLLRYLRYLRSALDASPKRHVLW
jgi:glycosyltransferase involved in cell wall biosynthesis